MWTAWKILAGVAALGIGFAAGALRPAAEDKNGGAEPCGDSVGITMAERPGDREARAGNPGRGSFDFATFAEAAPRLDELTTAYGRLTSYQIYTNPLPAERILDEAEGIFALAKPDELAAFLESFDAEAVPMEFFETALAALARITPARAAGIGLACWEDGEKEPVGLLALLREWEKRDPRAVDRWIADLDERLRPQAEIHLLALRAATDPADVLTEIENLDPQQGTGIALVLAQTLAPEELPGAAELLLAERDDGSTAVDMLPGFLREWSLRDSDGALDWLSRQDLDAIGPERLEQGLSSLAVEDPAAFLAELETRFDGHSALHRPAGQAWWAWIASGDDPSGPMQWLAENEELATGFASYQIADWATRSENWTAQRTTAVLEAFARLPETDRKIAFAQDFFERLSRYQPEAVLPFAMDHLPLGFQSNSTIAQTVGSWSRNGEPEAAIGWAMENLEDGNARHEALRFATGSWSEENPRAAADFALTLPKKDRDAMLDGLGHGWVNKDPDGVVAFLSSAEDAEAVAELTRDAFRFLGEDRSGSAWLSSALEMPPGKMRHDAVRGLFGGWALSDSAAATEAIESVPQGSLRNTAIQGFNSFHARRDPALAIELATRITNPTVRDKELTYRAREWLRKDPDEARAAIRAHSEIPDSVKQDIFRK